ncbi:hypothetical protein T190130A13A_10242 [Tenacibaculum sp. 190130A14a]|uniref:Uncharacterized protein n=1 Tax=Tenacibaculum polynesiense TaxID=3137857 RepID=A0ABP1EU16_9FLAO
MYLLYFFANKNLGMKKYKLRYTRIMCSGNSTKLDFKEYQ